MSLRLNLAALTSEELQALLGEHGAQLALPEISRARLADRPFVFEGPPVEQALNFEALEEREWGPTPETSRLIARASAQLTELGARPLGTYYVPLLSEMRHQRGFLLAPDVAVALRWSETPESPRVRDPFLQALSWLKDRSSGIACVCTTTSPLTSAPTFSPEVDLRQLPTSDAAEVIAAHRQVVARYGRATRLETPQGWMRAWQELRALNIAAWERRGLLIEGAGQPADTTQF